MTTRAMTAAEYRAAVEASKPSGGRRSWSGAKRTPCRRGHIHDSGMEAKVCDRLSLECVATKATLFIRVRFPLLAIDPKKHGPAETITVDFVVVAPDGSWVAIDAKNPTRVSRDWRLRAAAFSRTYGREVSEVSR